MIVTLLLIGFITYYCGQKKGRVAQLLLINIEALASDGENNGSVNCLGTGSLDCPSYNNKVIYINR